MLTLPGCPQLGPENDTTNPADQSREFLANGWTATVYRLKNTQKVIKVLDKESYPREELFQRERRAYERMAQQTRPSSILEFYGIDDPLGLILELAENGNMHGYLWDCRHANAAPDDSTLLRWARQAAEALSFVHSCGIIHCDIHVANFFLDRDLNLKLGDFGACALDGEKPLMAYRRTHQLWVKEDEKWRKAFSISAEIFALGSAMFNMETMRDPLEELDNERDREEIARRIREKELPDTESLVALGEYVKKCWNLEYGSMSDMLRDTHESGEEYVHRKLEL